VTKGNVSASASRSAFIVGAALGSYGLGILIGLATGGGIWLVQRRRGGDG
jgi:hypothetical protein